MVKPCDCRCLETPSSLLLHMLLLLCVVVLCRLVVLVILLYRASFVSGGLAASPCASIMEMNTESIQAFKATSANTNLLICSSQVNCSSQPSQSNKRSQSNKSLQSNKRLAHDLSALIVTALILLFLFHLISCSCRTGLRVSDRRLRNPAFRISARSRTQNTWHS